MGEELIDRQKTAVSHDGVAITATSSTTMDKRLIWIMAIACGLAVANLYYIQPMLATMGRSFAVSASQIGFVATLGQIGYALGSYNQRALIVIMLGVVTVALAAMAFAPSFAFVTIASLFLGLTTVVPQLIIPYAANLAPEHERGRVVGTVMSSLLIGILLARTISGFVSAQWGWRTMYWIAAGLMILLALALHFALPDDQAKKSSMRYPQLLRSLWDLLRSELVLRDAGVF